MVNILKFKPKAEYDSSYLPLPNNMSPHVTGKQAYERYMDYVKVIIEKLGGRIIFSGDIPPNGLMIGSGADFDMVAIAEYPSMTALLKMNQSEEFKAISFHRKAGLIGQLLFETKWNAKL
jgi:uncharacterized protein (DUF1330 family)